jgi:hypothetical protein
MKGTTTFTSGWMFFAIVTLLASGLLVLPLQLKAQNNCPTQSTGQDAVYNTTCNNGPVVVGSSAFIDASMFASQGGTIRSVISIG